MTEPKEANEGLYVTCRHCASSFCAFTGECTATGAKLPRKLTPHEKAVREGRDAATLATENAALREKLAEIADVADIGSDAHKLAVAALTGGDNAQG